MPPTWLSIVTNSDRRNIYCRPIRWYGIVPSRPARFAVIVLERNREHPERPNVRVAVAEDCSRWWSAIKLVHWLYNTVSMISTFVCDSATARNPFTHSCLALASLALSFNMSPEAQFTVNVFESSSLGQITAPAKWTEPLGTDPSGFSPSHK